MVILFNPQFVSKIFTGTKIHTIRKDADNKARRGVIIHMNETPGEPGHNNCFRVETCVSVQTIEIDTSSAYVNKFFVKIDGRLLEFHETRILAWRDGFCNLKEFFLWFAQDNLQRRTLKLIHWTDYKY